MAISNYNKSIIVSTYSKVKLSPNIEKLKLDMNKVALEILYTIYNKEEIDAIPQGWLREENRFYARDDLGRSICLRLETYTPMPCVACDHCDTMKPLIPSNLAQKYLEAELALKEAEQEARNKLYQLDKTISQFGSIAKLVKEWPQVAEFVPEDLKGKSKASLPAIIIEDLNKQFNLEAA